jgi:hypothetical protein
MTQKTQSIHAEAGLHRKLVLFAVQLEGYLAHFPNCHKYSLTQAIRQAHLFTQPAAHHAEGPTP